MMGSLQLSKAADRLDTNAYQRASFPSVPPPLTKSYIRTRRTINIYWHPLPLSHRQTDRHTHTLSFPLSLFLYFSISLSLTCSLPLCLSLRLTHSLSFSLLLPLCILLLRRCLTVIYATRIKHHRIVDKIRCSALLCSAPLPPSSSSSSTSSSSCILTI